MSTIQRTLKIVIAIPHKQQSTPFDKTTCWSCGVFRRISDKIIFKLSSKSEFLSNYSGNQYYNCVIFTLNTLSVNEIDSYFANLNFKPIVKNVQNIPILQDIVSKYNISFCISHELDCRLIYEFTRELSIKLQNNFMKDLTEF